jgi:hypothetical protein
MTPKATAAPKPDAAHPRGDKRFKLLEAAMK